MEYLRKYGRFLLQLLVHELGGTGPRHPSFCLDNDWFVRFLMQYFGDRFYFPVNSLIFDFIFWQENSSAAAAYKCTSQHKDDPDGKEISWNLFFLMIYILCLNFIAMNGPRKMSDGPKVFISYLKGQIWETERGHIKSSASNIFQTFMNCWQ